MDATPRKPRQTPKAGEEISVDPLFAPVAAAFATNRAVGLGRMFSSNSVLNVGGKMFAMLVKGKFVAKLPRERVDALVSSGVGEHFDPGHGRLMKEWIALSDARASWVGLAREAYTFVKKGQPAGRSPSLSDRQRQNVGGLRTRAAP